MTARVERVSARVIVLDRSSRVLLVRVVDRLSGRPPIWVTPGGGVDPGEEFATTAVRELCEETGKTIEVHELGEPVAVTSGEWEWRGQLLHSVDWYYALRTDAFVPDETHYTDLEREVHGVWKWWSLDELDAARETVIPGGLAGLIRRLESRPQPAEPITLPWVSG